MKRGIETGTAPGLPARSRNAPPTSVRSLPPVRPVPPGRHRESDLLPALENLREAIVLTGYPLEVIGVDEARAAAARLLAQLDDHLLPRLRQLDAPLLAVVAGSTGAGKSTLVNSLVRAPVSTSGVLRPTTRAPVLVSHPLDASWFVGRQVMAGLAVIPAPELTPGLALVDAPDLDSVLDDNRDQARHLMARADLWIFVTTAERYADAAPWEALRIARDRQTPLAVVLDRVPPEDAADLTGELRRLLLSAGLGDPPLFVVPEVQLDREDMLPEELLGEIRSWLGGTALDVAGRSRTAQQAAFGPVSALLPKVELLAVAATDQVSAASALLAAAREPFEEAANGVLAAVEQGALVEGPAQEPWRELMSGGDVRRAVHISGGGLRGRLASTAPVRPEQFVAAMETALAELLVDGRASARAQASTAWLSSPGSALLPPDSSADEAAYRALMLAEHWQRWLESLAQIEGVPTSVPRRRRARAAGTAYLLAVVAVAAPPTGTVEPASVRRLVEAARADDAAAVLAEIALTELRVRVHEYFEAEAREFHAPLDAAAVNETAPILLRTAGRRVEEAAREARQ